MPNDFPETLAPLALNELLVPENLTIAVLAPHPDDFDAISISLRYLQKHGAEIHLAVLTTGASGVEDGFAGVISDMEKAAVREAEQTASCRFFGLPEERLRFLRLPLEIKDDAPPDEASIQIVREFLHELRPKIVFLPHGNDSNVAHRRTHAALHEAAAAENLDLIALLNQDAKTLEMREDVFMPFGEEEAAWKAELLRFHLSQQQRNLNTRGHGFDERVLQINRAAAEALGVDARYAEVFELERFGA